MKTFLTKVEDAVSQEGSKSQVEGMTCLLLLGKAGNLGASQVSEKKVMKACGFSYTKARNCLMWIQIYLSEAL